MLDQSLRWMYRRVFPRWTKNALAFSLTEIERFQLPELLALPPGRRVLVLAPHADDESIGCGGTLCKYAQSGADVHVAFLTDGGLGNRDLRRLPANHPERAPRTQALVQQRRDEAAAALSVLGISACTFLDAPDGGLDPEDSFVITKLTRLLREFEPEIIFLPFMTDRHPDHSAASGCLLNSLEQVATPALKRVMLCGYEVWSPIHANVLVDITAHAETKRRALEQYAGQNSDTDYVASILGLNRYRSITALHGKGYCEAFYLAPFDDYRRLYQRMRI
jgi:LmbE family N-acetylglucosaminyl deacetylase